MKETKLAILVVNLTGGGAERAVVNLANYLADKGFHIDFLQIEGNRAHDYSISDKIRIIKLDRFGKFLAVLPLIAYILREKPLLIYSILDLANVTNLIARRILGSRYQPYIGIQNITSKHIRSPIKKIVEKSLLKFLAPFAENIIAVSEGVASDFAEYIEISVSRIQVVCNPILTPNIEQLALEKNIHPWLQNKSSSIILSIGRLNAQKDFPTLIRAFNILVKKRKARLIILGEGECRAEIDAVISELDLQEIVALPGFEKNPYSYLKNCDLFVLSSLYEGLPSVLLEALAIGCPTVSTDCESGPYEILEGGKYGELVPVGDYNIMAGAISRTLDGNSKKVDQKWRARFSIEVIMEEYMTALGISTIE